MTNTPPQLSEKDFFNESYRKDPFPFWFWLIVTSVFVAILWGAYAWYGKLLKTEYKENPFLQVTNREMSVFLWQEPSLMRVNAPAKSAYMPGFQYIEKFSVDVPYADDYVIAPPEVIFRYHAWHRLVSNEFAQRPISVPEFKEFLNYAEEWLPRNWPSAPKGYADIIASLDGQSDLAANLPLTVRQAFQGWKNFFKEGDAINALRPRAAEVQAFLLKYPHYARNYWRNIAGTRYLQSLLGGGISPDASVPIDELPGFLLLALYNDLQLTGAGAPVEG